MTQDAPDAPEPAPDAPDAPAPAPAKTPAVRPRMRSEPPRGARKWIRRGIQVGLVLAALFAVRAYQQRGVASGMAPPIDAPALDGTWLKTSDLRGQPVLVHFWASWCGVCRVMEGSVVDVARDHRVVAVATRSGDVADVAQFARAHHLEMPIVLDERGAIAAAYGVQALPTSFVVGPDGRIRFTEVGYTTELGLRARLWLAGR